MKQYLRGNIELISTKCKKCGKDVIKNTDKQIVFFCSKQCRKNHRGDKNGKS